MRFKIYFYKELCFYLKMIICYRFGVGLVGVQRDASNSSLLLNPGPSFVLRATDICYYMGLTSEEELPIETKQQQMARTKSERKRKLVDTIPTIGNDYLLYVKNITYTY